MKGHQALNDPVIAGAFQELFYFQRHLNAEYGSFRITTEQFDYLFSEKQNQIYARIIAYAQQKQTNRNANAAQSRAQLDYYLNMMKPRPLPPSTTCRTNNVGGTLITQCN